MIGVPNPLLWGILAAIFNYLPYIGVSVLTLAVLVVSILNFDTPTMWLAGPLLIIAMSTIEGQFLTPTILGRHLSLNPVSVLLAVVFWGWLWGIPGALIAVPLLVVTKVICERVDGLSAIAEFLAAHDPRERQPEEAVTKGTNGKS
jgi:predicted PurR-regulated permease PerM